MHSAVDDYSRAAYSEILPDETGASCAGFLPRAAAHFARHDVRISEVITDNHLTTNAQRRSPRQSAGSAPSTGTQSALPLAERQDL